MKMAGEIERFRAMGGVCRDPHETRKMHYEMSL